MLKQGPDQPDYNACAGPRTPRLYPSMPHAPLSHISLALYLCAWMCAPVFVPPLCGGRSRVVARDTHACVGHAQRHARPLVCPPRPLSPLPYLLTTSNPSPSPPTSPSLSGLFPSTLAWSALLLCVCGYYYHWGSLRGEGPSDSPHWGRHAAGPWLQPLSPRGDSDHPP